MISKYVLIDEKHLVQILDISARNSGCFRIASRRLSCDLTIQCKGPYTDKYSTLCCGFSLVIGSPSAFRDQNKKERTVVDTKVGWVGRSENDEAVGRSACFCLVMFAKAQVCQCQLCLLRIVSFIRTINLL